MEEFSGRSLHGVGKIDPAELESGKDRSHLRHIIQREYELAAHFSQSLREFLEVALGKIEAVKLAPEIGRVEVEKRAGAVVALQDVLIRQVFNLHAEEPVVRVFDKVGKTLRIESRRLLDGVAECPVAHEPSVGVLLQVEKAGAALDVGEELRILCLQEIEPLAAHDHEFHVAHEFFVVRLAHAEERHDFSVEIVQDLDRRRLFVEEHLRAASEYLDVGFVLREYLDNFRRDAVLAADVGQRSFHVWMDLKILC